MSRKECKVKVAAFVLRQNPEGKHQLLAHAFADDPSLPLRVPGGGVDAGEEPHRAVLRELEEESGLVNLQLVRELGVRRYFKSFIGADVERHDFLFRAPPTTPDIWERQVGGSGADAGERFTFQWLGTDELSLLDDEHGQYVTPALLPELFWGTQTHSHLVAQGRGVWYTERLWHLARSLPTQTVAIESIREFDQNCWFRPHSPPSVRAVAEHARRINEADLSYPIILSADGGLMDGGHRIAKAWLLGHADIQAVQFLTDPEPDLIIPELTS